MSVESLAIALHHSQAVGTAKLVLVGIANHDGDGGAWPSIATLAHYAGVDARSVQRALEKLIALGEIERDVQGGGDYRVPDHRKPNLYRFLLACPQNCDRTRNHRTRLQKLYEERVTPASPGDASVTGGVTPVSPKPSSKTNHRDRAQFAHVSSGAEALAPCGHKWMADCIGRYCEFGHATQGARA